MDTAAGLTGSWLVVRLDERHTIAVEMEPTIQAGSARPYTRRAGMTISPRTRTLLWWAFFLSVLALGLFEGTPSIPAAGRVEAIDGHTTAFSRAHFNGTPLLSTATPHFP